jgi:hypothetical protein
MMFSNPKVTFSRRRPLPLLSVYLSPLSAYLSPLSASLLFDFSPFPLLSTNLKLQAYSLSGPTHRKIPKLFDRRSFKYAVRIKGCLQE